MSTKNDCSVIILYLHAVNKRCWALKTLIHQGLGIPLVAHIPVIYKSSIRLICWNLPAFFSLPCYVIPAQDHDGGGGRWGQAACIMSWADEQSQTRSSGSVSPLLWTRTETWGWYQKGNGLLIPHTFNSLSCQRSRLGFINICLHSRYHTPVYSSL